MECDQLLPAEPGRGGHPHGHLQLHLLLHLHAGQADMAAMFNTVWNSGPQYSEIVCTFRIFNVFALVTDFKSLHCILWHGKKCICKEMVKSLYIE